MLADEEVDCRGRKANGQEYIFFKREYAVIACQRSLERIQELLVGYTAAITPHARIVHQRHHRSRREAHVLSLLVNKY